MESYVGEKVELCRNVTRPEMEEGNPCGVGSPGYLDLPESQSHRVYDPPTHNLSIILLFKQLPSSQQPLKHVFRQPR